MCPVVGYDAKDRVFLSNFFYGVRQSAELNQLYAEISAANPPLSFS